MKKILSFIAAIFLLVALVSCERNGYNPDMEDVQVRFSSVLNGESSGDIATKAKDDRWSVSDRIGVFMKSAGSDISAATESNKVYITKNGDGVFVAADNTQAIKYPSDGSSVDFIAYYPYQSSASNGSYTVDLTNQENQEAIDLIYSKNLTSVHSGNMRPELAFSHALVKLVLNISPESGGALLNGLTAKITGMKSKAVFNLGDGSLSVDASSLFEIPVKMSANGSTIRGEAVLLPMSDLSGSTVVFTMPSGDKFTWKMQAGKEFKSGYRYSYNIVLKTGGVVVTPGSNNWFEIPTISSSIENTLFVKHLYSELTGSTVTETGTLRNFSMLYDTKNRLSYWVAYPLTSSDLGSSGRTDAWGFDPKVPQLSQPNLNSGFGYGFDRGHQIPSADRTTSRSANATTFYYTNMTPQNSTLNQGLWARLEGQVRSWIPAGDTLYVITGAIPDNPPVWTNQGTEKAAVVPKFYFKALAKLSGGKYYTIGFKVGNAPPASASYNDYRMTVSALEAETGFELFPRLSSDIKNKIDVNIW